MNSDMEGGLKFLEKQKNSSPYKNMLLKQNLMKFIFELRLFLCYKSSTSFVKLYNESQEKLLILCNPTCIFCLKLNQEKFSPKRLSEALSTLMRFHLTPFS